MRKCYFLLVTPSMIHLPLHDCFFSIEFVCNSSQKQKQKSLPFDHISIASGSILWHIGWCRDVRGYNIQQTQRSQSNLAHKFFEGHDPTQTKAVVQRLCTIFSKCQLLFCVHVKISTHAWNWTMSEHKRKTFFRDVCENLTTGPNPIQPLNGPDPFTSLHRLMDRWNISFSATDAM